MIYAVLAYLTWGLVPLFWKLLGGVPALDILANRVIWSLAFYGALLIAFGQVKRLSPVLRSAKQIRALCASGLLIALNWGLYIHAVNSGQVLAGSLGYFINPLMNVILGMVFLGEKLSRLQWWAVAFASAGVLQIGALAEGLPWLAICLAITFSLYGLVRKKMGTDPLVASTLESALLVPVALAYLMAYPGAQGFQDHSLRINALLAAGGIVTGLPLLWFVMAAKRLPLSTLGFFQYLSPSLQFGLAVFVFGEAFTAAYARGFALIWIGLAIFAWGAVKAAHERGRR